jgi:hypothetical protein
VTSPAYSTLHRPVMHGLVQSWLPMACNIVFEVSEKQIRDSITRSLEISCISSIGRVVRMHFPLAGGEGQLLGKSKL